MIRSYLKIAWRTIKRHTALATINTVGLSIGIASFILVTQYVKKELSYDRFPQAPDEVYRIVTHFTSKSESFSNAQTPPNLISSLRQQFPQLTAATRLFRYRSDVVVVDKQSNTSFTEPNFLWTDPDIFSVFTIPMRKGNPKTAITNPNTVIVSESMARKYFGNKDPIGKRLINATFGAEFEITGVFQDFPENSHVKADFFCSLRTLGQLWGEPMMSSWTNSFLYSYIRMPTGTNVALFEGQLTAFLEKQLGLSNSTTLTAALQPLTGIHLTSHLMNELDVNGNQAYVYILSIVGLLILLVSCINFVNLGIARSQQRAKEIGIRKALGSQNRLIFVQMLVENGAYGLAAYGMAVGFISLLLPTINQVFNETMPTLSDDPILVAIGLLAVVGIIVLTSVYPSIFLAGLKIIHVLKGKPVQIGKGINVWKGLITFQMAVTVFLLIACLVINRQLTFLQSKKLGYQLDHIVNIPLLSDESQRHCEQLKNRLLQSTLIESASATSHLIGGTLYQSGYLIDKPQQERIPVTWQRFHADYDFVTTNRLTLAAGRDLSMTFGSDSANFLINEAACRALGLGSPQQAIGLTIDRGEGHSGKIVGVIRDFHFKSLHSPIEPLAIHYESSRFRFLTVRLTRTANPLQSIDFLKKAWTTFAPGEPFAYSFPDQFTRRMYAFEQKLRWMITGFTLIVLGLSIGGLIGLSYYTIQLKTKEIGIRKVLGASVASIISLLYGSFLKLMGFALLLAFPLAWTMMGKWLQDFSYRIDLSWWMFALAGLVALGTVLGAVSFQSIKAALMNPVKSLRSE